MIKVDPALVGSIPENDHLYIGSSSGKELALAFTHRNRERWWNQQMSNSSTLYFFPQSVVGQSVFSRKGTIAHIFIFLATRLRLCLPHSGSWGANIFVSVQENAKELRRISTNEIPEKLRLKDFELDQFEPGGHELELVVASRGLGAYNLLVT